HRSPRHRLHRHQQPAVGARPPRAAHGRRRAHRRGGPHCVRTTPRSPRPRPTSALRRPPESGLPHPDPSHRPDWRKPMIPLPYTELRVPTTTLRVTNTTLLADGRILSTVQDGETVLGKLIVGPHAVDLNMNVDARRLLSAFTGLCWTEDGKRPSRATVLRELVMEYRYARAITEATQAARPTVAVRAFHTDGTTTLHQVDAPGPIGPGPELKVDPALFTTDVVRVQAWMRDLWLGVSPLLPGQEHQPPTR